MGRTEIQRVELLRHWNILPITPPLQYSKLIRIFFTLLVASTIACLSCVEFATAKPITLAYQTPTLGSNLPIFVAMEFGLFAAENLEAKTVFIQGGPTAMAALLGGDVDYIKVAGVPAARAIAQGTPLAIAGGFQPYIDYTLIGSKKITSLNELRGKIVGVTGAGGIAEFATVEGLARKGFVRDRDYKILYGAGNSPARAQALDAGRIQAAPFSFVERLDLEQRGFPVLFDIGTVMPKFPFVVLLTSKRKAETAPDEIVIFLKILKRSMDIIRTDKDRVVAAIVKKRTFGDPTLVRKVVDHFAEFYSIGITKEDVEELAAVGKVETEVKKLGGAERIFLGPLVAKALAQTR
jgi:ABC-type nitrate/sulfonate/bicarbonate transport system substrate-binding protein